MILKIQFLGVTLDFYGNLSRWPIFLDPHCLQEKWQIDS